MNKLVIALLMIVSLAACKNNSTTEQTDEVTDTEATDSLEYKGPTAGANLPTYRGEFYYSEEAAVLKGKDFIYGVKRDSMAEVLARMVEPAKQDEFDMVPVIVDGLLNKKEEGADGWDEILTIKRIVTVSSKAAQPDIKIEEKQ